jgi:serine protease AprX
MTTPERVGALDAYTGRGVTVAFVDSGFYAHPDLQGRVVTHVDCTTFDAVVSPVIPKSLAFSWHGMMTSVIGCGDGSRSGGKYRGIASEASLVLIKVSNPRGWVKEDDILRGMQWLKANHRRYGIRVVNLSVGGDFVSFEGVNPLHKIVRELVDEGVVVVAAAGNRPVNHLLPPASAAEAITVGGLDDQNSRNPDDWRLYGHNYGLAYDGTPKPDLVAPARWIASPILPSTSVAWEAFWIGPLLEGQDEHPIRALMESGKADRSLRKIFGTGYSPNLLATLQSRAYQHKLIDAFHQHVDGTSVAAPIVTAVVAQMLQARPELTPDEVRRALMSTAKPLPGAPRERQGAGILNAAAAVARVLQSAPPLN